VPSNSSGWDHAPSRAAVRLVNATIIGAVTQEYRTRVGEVIAAIVLSIAFTVVVSGCNGHKTNTSVTAASARTDKDTEGAGSSSAGTTKAFQPYLESMRNLGTKLAGFVDSVQAAESAVSGSPDEGTMDATSLRSLQRDLKSVATELATVRPPPAVALDQKLLIKGVREYAAELTGVIIELRSGDDPPTVLASIVSLRGVKEMERASREITRKGYSIVNSTG